MRLLREQERETKNKMSGRRKICLVLPMLLASIALVTKAQITIEDDSFFECSADQYFDTT